MTRITPSEIKTQVGTERSVPRLRLPYPSEVAAIISIQALDFCAQKMELSSRYAVLKLLEQGDDCADAYYCYSIAEQATEYLGALDEEITAVYIVDYVPPDELYSAERPPTSPTTLIFQVERKSQYLVPLIQRLNRALARRYANMTGLPQSEHLFDVYVLKDQDIKTMWTMTQCFPHPATGQFRSGSANHIGTSIGV